MLKHGKGCIIEKGVEFGDNVEIENFTHIRENSIIGDNSYVGNFCELGEESKIGKNVVVQGRNRMAKNCVIEDNVTIKYGTILTSGVKIKKNAFLGPNVITFGSDHKGLTRHGTVIGENTWIGGGTTIAPNIKIGNNIIIGAMSFVNKDIDKPGTYVGIPVRQIKKGESNVLKSKDKP